MISVVMASTLAHYKGAASHRDKKIFRAVHSLSKQTYTDFELIVVSDGCQKTYDLMSGIADKCVLIDKQPIWSGVPRNTGIDLASGDIIVYLDNDDAFDYWHLEHIAKNFEGDSLLFGDLVPVQKSFMFKPILTTDMFRIRSVSQKLGYCGTSNIAHTKGVYWEERSDYAHDWHFIKQFDPKVIKYGGYMVCHVPKMYDI